MRQKLRVRHEHAPAVGEHDGERPERQATRGLKRLSEAGGVAHREAATIILMHFDAHQPIIADLEARITTIRDSL